MQAEISNLLKKQKLKFNTWTPYEKHYFLAVLGFVGATFFSFYLTFATFKASQMKIDLMRFFIIAFLSLALYASI